MDRRRGARSGGHRLDNGRARPGRSRVGIAQHRLDRTQGADTAPADRLVTRAASIQIVANASDALSGVASATCGGVPAGVDSRGGIRCVVDLLPGINDVVVEATDHADNSGSIGIRVTRTGDTSTLRVVPQVLSVLVGRARPLQVMDEYGPVQDVTWTVDNPGVADIADETNVLTPKAAGVVTVTAWHGGISASAVVNVHHDRLPLGAIRWRSGGASVIQAFPPPAIKEDPPRQCCRSPSRRNGVRCCRPPTRRPARSSGRKRRQSESSRSRSASTGSPSEACCSLSRDATASVRRSCAAALPRRERRGATGSRGGSATRSSRMPPAGSR